MIKFLYGKKSYFISLAIFAAGGAFALGWIDEKQLAGLVTMLNGLAVSSLRAGISKA